MKGSSEGVIAIIVSKTSVWDVRVSVRGGGGGSG